MENGEWRMGLNYYLYQTFMTFRVLNILWYNMFRTWSFENREWRMELNYSLYQTWHFVFWTYYDIICLEHDRLRIENGE